MTTTQAKADATPAKLALPSAEDMRDVIEQKHKDKLAEQQKKAAAAAEEKKHQEEAFLARKLTQGFIDQVMHRIREAAESGATEIMVGRFPSAWCTDSGRKINAPEASWPDTLQGIAKEFYEFWERDLKPRGFHLHVQILDFPGGMPGDVGAFLSWKAI
jgi:hypothetical protein